MAPQRLMVGRQAERTALRTAVDAVAAGHFRLVGVSGEPGIGKTRMLSWLCDHARARDLPVLDGAAEFETDVPFGLLVAAVGPFLAGMRDELRDRLGEDRHRLAGTVFPELMAGGASDTDRYRLHRALRSVLEAITPATGLVLCLDDLHLADPATCDFVAHLVRHPLPTPMLLALAYRPRQQPARLADALRGAPGTRLALGPLSRAETAELSGPGFVDASGGNPRYAELLADDDPAMLAAAFARELRGLEALDRTVLETAAVVGDEFDPHLVAAIARRPVGDVLGALDRLAARDLVRAAATGPRLRHRHPLVRRAAYLDSDPDWRWAAHRRAWAVLAAQGAPAPAVARHVAECASAGDRAGIDVLLAAADATRVTAPAGCARWLAVALSLLPDTPSTVDERVALLTMRARALGMAGRFEPARVAIREALALLPANAAEQRAAATAFLAMVERMLGRFDVARDMVLAELATQGRGPGGAVLLFELALGGLLSAAPNEPPWAERAVAAARALSDPAHTAAALAVRALHDLIHARWTAETRDRVREAVTLVDALTDGQLAERLDAAVWIGWCELSLDRFVDAARHLERGLALSRTTGQDHLVGYLRAGLGMAYASVGRLAVAAERATDASESCDELAGVVLAQRAWIEAWRGNVAEATEIVERLDGRAVADGMLAGLAGALAALVRHVAGDSNGCVDRLLRAGGGPELPTLDGSARVAWYQLLAEADVTAGRPERAQIWAVQAQWAAEAVPLPRKRAFAALAWAWARSTGDPAGAAAAAERAARMFADMGDRVTQGRSLLLAGQCRASAGDTEVAKRLLADAERVFVGCGAMGFADQAARARRRPGRRTTPGDDPSSLALLTERERAVATLVAAGHTNREVASALYLSARTVEAHLTRVYAKLGVSSRNALASQVRP